MSAHALSQTSFTGAIVSALNGYTDFEGRASRREYWFFTLFVVLASLTTLALDLGLWRSMAFTPINAFFAFLTFVPCLAVLVRRLHDVGRSGWWLAIMIVPVVGACVLLYWTCRRGEPVPNTYGLPMA